MLFLIKNPSNLISSTTVRDCPRELPSNLQAEQNFPGALLLDNDISIG